MQTTNHLSRRSFLQASLAALLAGVTWPGAVFAGQESPAQSLFQASATRESLLARILDIEKEHASYLNIPDFDLGEYRAICDQAATDMARAAAKGLLGSGGAVPDEKSVQDLFMTYDDRLASHFAKEQEGRDIVMLSQGIAERTLDCDLLSYFFVEAGIKNSLPIHAVYVPGHVLAGYFGPDHTVYFETLHDTQKRLRNDETITASSHLLRALGIDQDRDIHRQMVFPSRDKLIQYNRMFDEKHKISSRSLTKGMHLKPLSNQEIISLFSARYVIVMTSDWQAATRKGCLEKALTLARNAVALFDDNDLAYTALARVHFYMRDPQTALAYEHKALERNPENAHTATRIRFYEERT